MTKVSVVFYSIIRLKCVINDIDYDTLIEFQTRETINQTFVFANPGSFASPSERLQVHPSSPTHLIQFAEVCFRLQTNKHSIKNIHPRINVSVCV